MPRRPRIIPHYTPGQAKSLQRQSRHGEKSGVNELKQRRIRGALVRLSLVIEHKAIPAREHPIGKVPLWRKGELPHASIDGLHAMNIQMSGVGRTAIIVV